MNHGAEGYYGKTPESYNDVFIDPEGITLKPGGLRVGCANGPVREQVWRDVSAAADEEHS